MTLTAVATFTRRFISIFVVSLILGITSFIGYRIWYANYLANLPPIEEKPDTRFGILPAPNFPISNVSSSNFSYTLDTTTGGLPQFEKLIKVFFVPYAYATLLAGEKSDELAQKFGVDTTPEILSDTQYRYKNNTRNLLVDLDTGNFKYSNEATPTAQTPTREEDNRLIEDFKNLLNSFGLLKEELKNGAGRVELLKIEGSEAGKIQISIWPIDVEGKPIINSDFNKSQILANVNGPANHIENYLSLDYTFWPIDTSSFATYPIKAVTSAFDDLKSGKGVILIEPSQSQISITSVYLAYFQSADYSPYLQPVFVFEGPGFVAVVSAIVDTFTE